MLNANIKLSKYYEVWLIIKYNQINLITYGSNKFFFNE
jgi:hypothetical protein